MSHKDFSPRVGDWVEVLSAAEIVATLDERGEFERMPLMPEMLAFAGRRYQVTAVAHKTCDTVNRTGGRWVRGTVHLADLRCDGAAHGGCQAACLLFWKTRWLRRVDGPHPLPRATSTSTTDATGPEWRALAGHATRTTPPGDSLTYTCQATTLPEWSQAMRWWDPRQYWHDVRSGNVAAGHALATLLLAMTYHLRGLTGGYRLSVWLYGPLHRLLKGRPDPHGAGTIPLGSPTPEARTDLRVGELVEVCGAPEIYRTVNVHNKNRGMWVDEEMTKYCGGRFRVARRVDRIINEQTGKMMQMKNPCIVLDGANCTGEYSSGRLLCPRRITAYWREIWLRRVDETQALGQVGSSGARTPPEGLPESALNKE
jgi:hypothetical protein